MGADLVCAYLEIPNGRKPNWKAANKQAALLSEEGCREVIARAIQADDDEQVDEYLEGRTAQEAVKGAVVYVMEAWGEHYRHTVVLDLSQSRVVFVGDTSWGDPVEGIAEFAIFAGSGCARVAGFLLE